MIFYMYGARQVAYMRFRSYTIYEEKRNIFYMRAMIGRPLIFFTLSLVGSVLTSLEYPCGSRQLVQYLLRYSFLELRRLYASFFIHKTQIIKVMRLRR